MAPVKPRRSSSLPSAKTQRLHPLAHARREPPSLRRDCRPPSPAKYTLAHCPNNRRHLIPAPLAAACAAAIDHLPQTPTDPKTPVHATELQSVNSDVALGLHAGDDAAVSQYRQCVGDDRCSQMDLSGWSWDGGASGQSPSGASSSSRSAAPGSGWRQSGRVDTDPAAEWERGAPVALANRNVRALDAGGRSNVRCTQRLLTRLAGPTRLMGNRRGWWKLRKRQRSVRRRRSVVWTHRERSEPAPATRFPSRFRDTPMLCCHGRLDSSSGSTADAGFWSRDRLSATRLAAVSSIRSIAHCTDHESP